MALDVAWAQRWVRRSAQVVTEHRAELIELDRQIGDGDHGENLYRGFTAVVAKLDGLEQQPEQVADVLKLVATTLMSTVGGAAGPLYGTAYLRAAKVEKTMVDAWTPAAAAAAVSAAGGGSPQAVLEAAATAAEEGAVSTDPMLATKGRASYLGERSIGHRDPGAASSALLLRAAADAVSGGSGGSDMTDTGA